MSKSSCIRSAILSLALSTVILPLMAAESNPYLGSNVISAGDFETWEGNQPEGWTVEATKGKCGPCDTIRATGKRSIQMEIPANGGSVRAFSGELGVEPGQWYLIRFMYRVEGLSKSQAYEGGQAGMSVEWTDAQSRVIRRDYVSYTYFPIEMTYRDQLMQAPAAAVGIRASLELNANEKMTRATTAWFDDVAICRYTPPQGIGEKVTREWSVVNGREILKATDAPTWFYLSGVEGLESVQAVRERDPASMLGSALHARPDVPPGIVYHMAYSVEQPPGLYRVFFRVRTPAALPEHRTQPLIETDVISSNMGFRGSRVVTAADFKKAGEYEEFWFDFVKPSTGWVCFRMSTPGKEAEFWVDYVRFVQLYRFRDPDLLTWYPGLAGSIGDDATLDAKAPARALLVEGMLGEAYRCGEAIVSLKGWETTLVRTEMGQSGAAISKYPMYWNELRSHRLVILANASVEALGPSERYQLKRFVEAGGGLLVLGGKSAYGNGGIRGSFLEDVLPVQVSDTRFDIAANRQPLALDQAGESLKLPWTAGLVSPWMHRVTVRNNAAVLTRAGTSPFLVAGQVGKGRVACLIGTPYGTAPGGSTLFTEWKDYPNFISQLLLWLTGGKP